MYVYREVLLSVISLLYARFEALRTRLDHFHNFVGQFLQNLHFYDATMSVFETQLQENVVSSEYKISPEKIIFNCRIFILQ